jgi:two-component system, NarL family, invasion response regulator UvrY
MKVLVASDHEPLCMTLLALLRGMPEVEDIASAAAADELPQKLRGGWELLLLDLDMFGRKPLDMLRLVKLEYAHIPVLTFSMQHEEHLGLLAIRAGAAGYIDKRSSGEQFIDAVRVVSTGGVYMSATLAGALARQL